MSQLDSQVNRIEAEKLRAVGLRNRVATLEEVRRSDRRAVHTPGPHPQGPTTCSRVNDESAGAAAQAERAGTALGGEARGAGAVRADWGDACSTHRAGQPGSGMEPCGARCGLTPGVRVPAPRAGCCKRSRACSRSSKSRSCSLPSCQTRALEPPFEEDSCFTCPSTPAAC